MKIKNLKLWLGALALSGVLFCPTLNIGASPEKAEKAEKADKDKDKDKDKADKPDTKDKPDKPDTKDKPDKPDTKDKPDKPHTEHPPKPPKDNDKVTICHKGHTIMVSMHALQAHLNHGDTIGSCVVTDCQNR